MAGTLALATFFTLPLDPSAALHSLLTGTARDLDVASGLFASTARAGSNRRSREHEDESNDRTTSGSSSSTGSSRSSSGSNSNSATSKPATVTTPATATTPAQSRAVDSNDRFAPETRGGASTERIQPARATPTSDPSNDEAARTMRPVVAPEARSFGRADRRDYERVVRSGHVANEVLASRPSAAMLARAKELNFGVGSSRASGLTRLVTPDGLDAVSAIRRLEREFPNDRFGLNKLYQGYRPAVAPSAIGPGLAPPTGKDSAAGMRSVGSGPCTPDRCFGSALIRWRSELSRCATGLRIGVLDTAVDHLHPALQSRRINLGTFIPEGQQRASNWHGTGVLALLAGAPGSGTPGLVPDASFYVADVFRTDSQGQSVTETASLIEALDWMQRFKVKVVNASVAGPADALLAEKIQQLQATGMIFIAAAGNGGPAAPPSFPAAYPDVIAVTAVDRNLGVYRYANRGKYVDIAAPGVDIWTAVPGQREGYQTGTSFAVPYVTALVASVVGRNETLAKSEVLRRISVLDLGTPGRDETYGLGVALAPSACGGGQPAAVSASTNWSPHVMRATATPDKKPAFSLAGSRP